MFQRYENRKYLFIIYFKSLQFVIVIEENFENDIYNNNDVMS